MVHQEGGQPSDDTLSQNDRQRPPAAQFPFDGGHRCRAGSVEQTEYQERKGPGCGQRAQQDIGGTKEDCQSGDHALFCHKAGDKRSRNPPVTKADWSKDGGKHTGHHRQDAVLRVCNQIKVKIKTLKKPNRNRRNKNDSESPLEEVLGLVPKQMSHIFRPRHPIVGQL